MEGSTSNEEDTDVEDDSLVDSKAVIPGVVTIHDREGQIKAPIPIKLPQNWTEMIKDPMKKLTVRIRSLKLPERLWSSVNNNNNLSKSPNIPS